MPTLADIRREYQAQALDESDAGDDPFSLFEQWMDAAIHAQVLDPTAMTLATVNANGGPATRIVLLKGFDHEGFVFFTNYTSQKGLELAHTPQASLLFFWPELSRQVRIDGHTTKISSNETEAYFRTRPRESQIGAWASHQSQPIPNRDVLLKQVHVLEQKFKGQDVPTPEFWGGYRLTPQYFEFWQGRENRLHDRLAYRLATQWTRERLSP